MTDKTVERFFCFSPFLSCDSNREPAHHTAVRHRLRRTRPTAASYLNPFDIRSDVSRAKSREIHDIVRREREFIKDSPPLEFGRRAVSIDALSICPRLRSSRVWTRGASRPAAWERAHARLTSCDVHVIVAPLRSEAARESRASCTSPACSRRWAWFSPAVLYM